MAMMIMPGSTAALKTPIRTTSLALTIPFGFSSVLCGGFRLAFERSLRAMKTEKKKVCD